MEEKSVVMAKEKSSICDSKEELRSAQTKSTRTRSQSTTQPMEEEEETQKLLDDTQTKHTQQQEVEVKIR